MHVVRVPERFRAEICAFGDERLPVLSHAVIDRALDYTGDIDTGQAPTARPHLPAKYSRFFDYCSNRGPLADNPTA